MLNRFFILIVAFVSSIGYLDAQLVGDPENEAHIHRGIQYVYNLSFDSAKAEFQQVAKSKSDHPAGHFFLAMIDWWRIVTNINDKSLDDRFVGELDHVIDLCDRRLDQNENDITGLFFKGGALGFEGRLYGNREEWLKAANAGRAALPIVRRAYKLEPNNFDVLLGIGIYNYYAAVVPDVYPFGKPFMIFFPKGDRQKGIEQLRTASEHARYAGIEATYFLMQALQNFEKQYPEVLPLAQRLHREFPNNPIFHKYVGRAQSALGMWQDMRQTYSQVLQRVKAKWTGYDDFTEREADYYLGLDQLNSGKYDDALQYLYRSDELSRSLDVGETSGFMVMTNLKIGMIYDLQGKRDLAVVQYKKVLDMKDYLDAHRQADQFLKTPHTKS